MQFACAVDSFWALLLFPHFCPGKGFVFSTAQQQKREGCQDDEPWNATPENMYIMQCIPHHLPCEFCKRYVISTSQTLHAQFYRFDFHRCNQELWSQFMAQVETHVSQSFPCNTIEISMRDRIIRVMFESPRRVPESMPRKVLRLASFLYDFIDVSLGLFPSFARQLSVELECVYSVPRLHLGSQQVQSHHVHDGSTCCAFFTAGGVPYATHRLRLGFPATESLRPSGVSVPARSRTKELPSGPVRPSSAGRGEKTEVLDRKGR